jgi:hypothetical protein
MIRQSGLNERAQEALHGVLPRKALADRGPSSSTHRRPPLRRRGERHDCFRQRPRIRAGHQ